MNDCVIFTTTTVHEFYINSFTRFPITIDAHHSIMQIDLKPNARCELAGRVNNEKDVCIRMHGPLYRGHADLKAFKIVLIIPVMHLAHFSTVLK